MFGGFPGFGPARKNETGSGSDATRQPIVLEKRQVPVLRVAHEDTLNSEEPIAPEFGQEEQESREGLRSREILRTLNPKSIVVFGATGEDNMTKPGYWMGSNTSASYRGDIHLVNPSKDELRYGTKSYPCVKDFGEIAAEVDPETTTFIFAIPPRAILGVLEQYGDRIKHCVITTAGFKESKGGEENDAALQELVTKHDITVIGPNCVGTYASNVRTEEDEQLGTLNATFAHHESLPESGLSMISSSGALVVGLLERLEHEGVGVNKIVSIGNGTTEIGHFVDAFVMDPYTKNIAIYAEGITERDIEAVREATTKKPVYIILPRGGDATDRASASHTAKALGSDADVVRAALEQSGAVVLDDLEEFYDTIAFAERVQELPRAQVTTITNSGGPGVLLAGYSGGEGGFTMPVVDAEIQTKLKKVFTTTGVSNPVDVRGDAGWVEYEKALTEVVEDEGTDIVLVTVLPTPLTPVEQIARGMVELQAKTDKRIVALFMGEEHMEEGRDILRRGGIAVFTSPERVVDAVNNVHRATQEKHRNKREEYVPDDERKSKAGAILSRVQEDVDEKGQARKALLSAEAAELFSAYGVRLAESRSIAPDAPEEVVQELDLDFTRKSYVLKVDPKVYPGGEKKLHKVGGAQAVKAVYLNLKTQEQFDEAYANLRRDFSTESLLLQPMVESMEPQLLIGAKRTENLGIQIVMGLGGIRTEALIKMTGLIERFNSVAGLDRASFYERVRNGKFSEYFEGSRSNPELANVLADHLWGLYQMMVDHPEIKEVDCNPVILTGENTEPVDVKVILDDAARAE